MTKIKFKTGLLLMKYLAVLLFSFLVSKPLRAQMKPTTDVATDKKAVVATVQALFDSMRASDTVRARSVMAPNLRIVILTKNPEEATVTRETTGQQFRTMMASRPANTMDERSWNGQVQLDGDLASYWCEYAFFNAGKFSHCGVDVFQLYRSPQGWKIINLAYNMRRENCDLKAIQPK